MMRNGKNRVIVQSAPIIKCFVKTKGKKLQEEHKKRIHNTLLIFLEEIALFDQNASKSVKKQFKEKIS